MGSRNVLWRISLVYVKIIQEMYDETSTNMKSAEEKWWILRWKCFLGVDIEFVLVFFGNERAYKRCTRRRSLINNVCSWLNISRWEYKRAGKWARMPVRSNTSHRHSSLLSNTFVFSSTNITSPANVIYQTFKKHGLKICMIKTELLKLKFKNGVQGNRSSYNVRLGGQLIYKVEKFVYFGWVMQENGGNVDNVVGRIKCGEKR